MTAVICTLKASTGKVTFLLQHLTNSNILPPGPICTASRKNTLSWLWVLIVHGKTFQLLFFFLLLTLQNIMLQHTIDRQPMLTGSMGQNNETFLKQFSSSTLMYVKLTMNTLFFQERAQGDGTYWLSLPLYCDSLWSCTISSCASNAACSLLVWSPKNPPFKQGHAINQSIKIIPLPSLKDS